MKLFGMLMVGFALVACGDDADSGDPGTSSTSGTSGTGGTDGTGGNGGTDGTGGNGGETGGDLDDKQLDSLTDEESQAVCEEIAASAEDLTKEDACEILGLVAAAQGGDCEAAKAACMDEPENPSEPGECPAEQFAGCTATVGEFTACTEGQFEVLKALTCESSLEDLALPAECAAISEECPELFETESEGEGGAGGEGGGT
ncbi:hypothetical protein WMF04_49905 [Sorangium sp. So ce260]|uniref:hypothetical protein n=1 Tax=Sorangium sp. So ce260 TaxID=3133291 RepID=UPI003F637C89